MKICFYIDAMDGGGAQRVLANVANALSAVGHDIYIVTSTSYACPYPLHSNIQMLNSAVGCRPISKSYLTIISRWFKILRNRRNYARQIKPDVAISFLLTTNYEVLLALLFTRIPVICCEHSNVSRRYSRRKLLLRSLIYPSANAITVLTRRDLSLWRNKYPQVVYMPNPSDAVALPDNLERKKIVLAVGRVTSWRIKGFDNLMRCWNLLYADFPDWELHVAGDYDDKSLTYLRSLLNEDVSNVRFLGFRKDVDKLMQEASVYCLSSRFEGLPMGLIEAMNAGCCCVAFDCTTGPREIIHDEISGLLAVDQNVEDLAAKLRLVMKNPVLLHRLAGNSAHSVECYSTDRVLSRWNILLDKVIKR